MKILVTGVLGFIGSYFAKYMINKYPDITIRGFSRNSSQANHSRLNTLRANERFQLIYGDLSDTSAVSELLDGVDVVVNFAAKTFVDHSIRDPRPFIESNIIGTYNLLEAARKYKLQKFIQISTDEVYGSISEGAHKETDALNPGNPYSAAKAAGDMLCLSYHNTYGIPLIITRTENNYGPFQHPQKALPTFVKKALNDENLPIYGDGSNSRMWLYVEDHCSAIDTLIQKGKIGEVYHVAGEQELTNLELGKIILKTLNKPEDNIEFIDDSVIRPGHDKRYALDVSKIKSLGWEAQFPKETGIIAAIEWYQNNQWWLK